MQKELDFIPKLIEIKLRRSCRAASWPTAPPPGGSLLPGAKMRLKINFIYIKVPTARQEGGRGAAAPQPGGRGINL